MARTVSARKLAPSGRKAGLISALLCLSGQLALPASADNPTAIAFGHHKKHAEQDSSNQPETTTPPATEAPGTITTPGTVPGVGAPPAVQPGNVPAPVLVTPSSLIDLNSGRFGRLQIDLQNGQFHDSSVDRATVTASEMDFKQGTLNALNINVLGGRFDQFIFDEMILTTAGNLHFDPNMLLQEKVLQFSIPAKADIAVSVSQDSLNKFLADPHTLENLSVTASKRLGALANLFGANVSNIGVIMREAHVVLNKANKIVIAITADLGMAGVGVPLSFEVDAQLGIKDGWVEVTDTHLMTNGQEISPQLSEMLVKKINSLADWGHKSDDIQFDFTEIKVVPGKQFSVKGTASIKRLRLTSPKEENKLAPQSAVPQTPLSAPPTIAPAPSTLVPVAPPTIVPVAPSLSAPQR